MTENEKDKTEKRKFNLNNFLFHKEKVVPSNAISPVEDHLIDKNDTNENGVVVVHFLRKMWSLKEIEARALLSAVVFNNVLEGVLRESEMTPGETIYNSKILANLDDVILISFTEYLWLYIFSSNV